jgi:hypothetical protein
MARLVKPPAGGDQAIEPTLAEAVTLAEAATTSDGRCRVGPSSRRRYALTRSSRPSAKGRTSTSRTLPEAPRPAPPLGSRGRVCAAQRDAAQRDRGAERRRAADVQARARGLEARSAALPASAETQDPSPGSWSHVPAGGGAVAWLTELCPCRRWGRGMAYRAVPAPAGEPFLGLPSCMRCARPAFSRERLSQLAPGRTCARRSAFASPPPRPSASRPVPHGRHALSSQSRRRRETPLARPFPRGERGTWRASPVRARALSPASASSLRARSGRSRWIDTDPAALHGGCYFGSAELGAVPPLELVRRGLGAALIYFHPVLFCFDCFDEQADDLDDWIVRVHAAALREGQERPWP